MFNATKTLLPPGTLTNARVVVAGSLEHIPWVYSSLEAIAKVALSGEDIKFDTSKMENLARHKEDIFLNS